MNIGKQLRFLRTKAGISQEKLAEILCIDRSTLAGYEIGRRIPNLDMLCQMADYFDVSTDYLLGRVEES